MLSKILGTEYMVSKNRHSLCFYSVYIHFSDLTVLSTINNRCILFCIRYAKWLFQDHTTEEYVTQLGTEMLCSYTSSIAKLAM